MNTYLTCKHETRLGLGLVLVVVVVVVVVSVVNGITTLFQRCMQAKRSTSAFFVLCLVINTVQLVTTAQAPAISIIQISSDQTLTSMRKPTWAAPSHRTSRKIPQCCSTMFQWSRDCGPCPWFYCRSCVTKTRLHSLRPLLPVA